jgi:hypothetical protein
LGFRYVGPAVTSDQKQDTKETETRIFPSLEDMIRMKKAAGRAKDREDLKFLKKLLKMKIEVVR